MIDTAAMAEFKPHLDIGPLRSPEILADAAHIILTSEATTNTGNFYIDDEVLATHGITDLSGYGPAGVADHDLMPDLFVSSLKEARSLPARSEHWEIWDTWHTFGLKGTGSHDVALTDVFVPDENFFELAPSDRRNPFLTRLDAGAVTG